MKSALIIRHVPYEGVAGFRQPIEAAGYDIERIDVADPEFSNIDLTAPDLLVMMGGPMGVYEHDDHPWIPCQLRRLAKRLATGKPTLGVCLGSQMIAAALGAPVYKGPHKEVGFHPIEIRDNALDGPFRHLKGVPVLHWHGDTFDLPPDVELLASSHLYAHQAFRKGANILALQFHAEIGLDPRFHCWIEESLQDVIEAGGTKAGINADHDRYGAAAVAAGRLMIADWLAQLEA